MKRTIVAAAVALGLMLSMMACKQETAPTQTPATPGPTEPPAGEGTAKPPAEHPAEHPG